TTTPEFNRATQPVQPVSHLTPVQSQSMSVISKALKITGQLESTENIQIDGEVEGDVRGVVVKVGQNAKVKGSVYGDEVELSGTVDGKIEAKKVVLTSSAHMSGDVIHQDITIQSGAYIAGHCRPEYGKSQSTPILSRPKEVLPRA
ncbi:MAG TPA: polymer-forming cytoskeletal protein, partial [Rhizomicrobium sp.]|nr:polymer-forming cytoskeletal protein [Rhizomicrobium sp.]